MTVEDLGKAIKKLNSLITHDGTAFYYNFKDSTFGIPDMGDITPKKFYYSLYSEKQIKSLTYSDFEYLPSSEEHISNYYSVCFLDCDNRSHYSFLFRYPLNLLSETRVTIRKNSVRFTAREGFLYIKKKQSQKKHE